VNRKSDGGHHFVRSYGVLFPTTTFVFFFIVVMPLSWLLLPFNDHRNDWLHRLPWKLFILVASYIFLGYHQPKIHLAFLALPLPCTVLAVSVVMNYALTQIMMRQESARVKKSILALTITANISMLGYFKYRNFLLVQAHHLVGFELPRLSSLIIPIAISFFTFQAISYVIDCYRGTIEKVSFADLAVYLSFFPHLVAGPIVRANEFIPQMRNPHNARAVEGTRAATLIARGLFKKMIIADLLYTQLVRPAFGAPTKIGAVDAIAAIYGYAAQLYCDFSGYTDIAIGIALLLGFKFPENFNRPYTATSLRDFWGRWHITLSRWLRDYVYIPLGGNRKSIFGARFIAVNVILTMAIGGLWHGASMTFVLWGLYHGIMLAIERVLRNFNARHDIEVPAIVRRILTFHVVTVGWILFASQDLSSAWAITQKAFSAFSVPPAHITLALTVLIVAGICFQFLSPRLTGQVGTYISTRPIYTQALVFGVCLLFLSALSDTVAAFVYGFF
jgi:D-alanyl-lipoteichoic acid acyltransferase DltB (MBOAT superfamily)